METQHAARKEVVTFDALDGRQLTGTLFIPAAGNGRSVLINSAMAVKRGYYAPYASFLAAQGFTVLTYDYRGIGDSLCGPIRQETATLQQWGEQDTAAAIAFLSARGGGVLTCVAHSAGGQVFGLAANNDMVAAILMVSCQSGYWKLWPWPRRGSLAALWYVGMPALTAMFGYFPARRLGLGSTDLPSGVAQQWARWCRNPNYFVDANGRPLRGHFSHFPGKILACTIEDDWMAPPPAVDALMDFYSGAAIEQRTIRAGDKGVGHFGYFRDKNRDVWKDDAAWLER